MYKYFFILAVVSFGFKKKQTTETRVISIEPEKSFQNYEHFKRLVLISPNSEAEHIENFQFEWGYHYQVKVEETRLQNALSDGTQYMYKLVDVVSKKKVAVDQEFVMFLDPFLYYSNSSLEKKNRGNMKSLRVLNDSTYHYFNEVEIVVPSELRKDFLLIYQGKSEKRGRFTHLDGNKIKLKNLF